MGGNELAEITGKRLLHGVPHPDKIGKPLAYFNLRNIFLDCRGDLQIHPTSEWGWFVMIITASHDISSGQYSDGAVERKVIVDEYAWIGSRALLYNCHVKHHGIVACGAVVRNMTVEPFTIVEGNPAVPTRHFVDGEWKPIAERTLDGGS